MVTITTTTFTTKTFPLKWIWQFDYNTLIKQAIARFDSYKQQAKLLRSKILDQSNSARGGFHKT